MNILELVRGAKNEARDSASSAEDINIMTIESKLAIQCCAKILSNKELPGKQISGGKLS